MKNRDVIAFIPGRKLLATAVVVKLVDEDPEGYRLGYLICGYALLNNLLN